MKYKVLVIDCKDKAYFICEENSRIIKNDQNFGLSLLRAVYKSVYFVHGLIYLK